MELLGPDGFDGKGWRDFVPGFGGTAEGKIRLSEGEEGVPEEGEWKQQECPRIRANIFQRLTFSWLTPMLVFLSLLSS